MPYPNTMALWPNFRSPLVWDVFAISTYIIAAILFLYLGLIKDFAVFRDSEVLNFQGWRKKLFTFLSSFETTYLSHIGLVLYALFNLRFIKRDISPCS